MSMRRWCGIVAIVASLGLASCAVVSNDTVQGVGEPPTPAQAACLGEGQLTVPRVDADATDLDAAPVPRHLRPLVYPQAARDAQATGTVHVRVLVCADGKVSDVRVVMGAPLLDDAGVETARSQAYVAALRGGRPVAAWFDVYVEFSLP